MAVRLSLVAALALTLLGASSAAAQPLAGDGPLQRVTGRTAVDAAFAPGEVVVQFRAGVSAVERGQTLAARDAQAARRLGRPGLVLVRLDKGESVRGAVASLERDPDVAFAEPNYLYRLTQTIPNDTDFGMLWGLHQDPGDHDIDAPEAWDTQTGSSSVIVAVIDSGVAYDHPELDDNVMNGFDFVQNDSTPLDFNGHGTHVAGTIGAEGNNAAGIAGVNWDVTIMPLRAGDAYGSLTNGDVAAAINYACANGAHIVNGSFGGAGKSMAISNAIKSSDCNQTLFVFAAGNSGDNLNKNTNRTNAYPCEFHRPAPHGVGAKNVICVGASNPSDGMPNFSNRGKSAVHLAAPGVNIYSSFPEWSPVLADDLEAGFTNWVEGLGQSFPNTSSTGPWQRTSELSNSGSFSMTDSPGGDYLNNRNYTIRNSAALNLTGRVGCGVDYALELEMLDFNPSTGTVFDWFAIERATGPGGPWTEISFYVGSSGGNFVPLTDDLSVYDGLANAYIRFLVHTDGSIRYGGAHVDDVDVRCLAAGGEAYAEFDGTSMAAPHVAGVAALLLAQETAMTPAQLKNAILKGVDKRAALSDKVSTGGRLNADRSLEIAMDHVDPETTITGHPPNQTSNDKATFRFVSNEAGSTFQCKHMGGPWQSCSSPKVYKNLNRGQHHFEVRAVDRNGNVDETPATDDWRIRR